MRPPDLSVLAGEGDYYRGPVKAGALCSSITWHTHTQEASLAALRAGVAAGRGAGQRGRRGEKRRRRRCAGAGAAVPGRGAKAPPLSRLSSLHDNTHRAGHGGTIGTFGDKGGQDSPVTPPPGPVDSDSSAFSRLEGCYHPPTCRPLLPTANSQQSGI